uniref:Uncharacterized protein n=1 Tax=Rhizophora mucronata TaxID=61149 RepID=A0A2P2KFI8_RHIMU
MIRKWALRRSRIRE